MSESPPRVRVAAERYALVALFGGAAMVAGGIVQWPDLTSRTPLPLILVTGGLFAMVIGLALTLGRQPLDGSLPASGTSNTRKAPWQVGRPLLQVFALFVFGTELLAYGQSRTSMALLSKGMAVMGGIMAAVAGLVVAITLVYSHRTWRQLVRLARGYAFTTGTVEDGTLLVDVTYYRKSSTHTSVTVVDGVRQESTSTSHWLEGHPRTSSDPLQIRVGDGSLTSVRASYWLAPVRYPASGSAKAAMRTIAQIAPGDRVIAVRAEQDSPIIVFGAGGDPRRALLWITLGWSALWWLLVIASLGCGVLAIVA